MYGLIYKITNLINGKIYIGQTTRNIYQRFLEHRNPPKRYRKSSYIYNSINKYGYLNFKIDILGYFNNQQELDLAEIYYIKHYQSLVDYNKGYNLTRGGNGGKHSEHSRKKLSKSLTGRKLTKEHIKKMSKSRKGRKKSLNWIKKIKKSNTGLKRSERTKENISLSKKGKDTWNKGKKLSKTHIENLRKSHEKYKVYQLSKKGVFIKRFNSIREASEYIGGNKSSIWQCCSGRIKTSKGFIWRYSNEQEK